MKTFSVTRSNTITVEAKNEEEARGKAIERWSWADAASFEIKIQELK